MGLYSINEPKRVWIKKELKVDIGMKQEKQVQKLATKWPVPNRRSHSAADSPTGVQRHGNNTVRTIGKQWSSRIFCEYRREPN